MKKLKILFIFILLIIIFATTFYFYKQNEIKNFLNNIEKEKINVDKYYIYGNHLNIEGSINKQFNNIKSVKLILKSNLEEKEYNIKYDLKNNFNFYTSEYINDGINLEQLNNNKFYILLKFTYENNNIEYYGLKNNTNYKNTTYYTINNYKWSLNGDYKNMTKYCTDANFGELDNKIVLELEDDAAHVNWGGDWRMPTKEQIQELLEECTYEGTTQKGVCGILITSKTNGNSIFMPAGGYRSLFSNYINQHCVYWSSSLNTNDSRNAYNLFSSLEKTSLSDNYNRYYGLLIRPVMSKK